MVDVLDKKVITPNAAQQKCIDTINGQILVLAGPGTGKTFTVIHRISAMLKQGIAPDKILCLTFSDAAASEMRHRIIKEIGVLAASVNIYTYHSFCNEILKHYPEEFGLSPDIKLITDTVKRELMMESIDEADLTYFVAERGGKYYYLGTFVNTVEKIKSKRIDKKTYFDSLNTNPKFIRAKEALELEIAEREAQGNTKNVTRYKELEKINANIEKAKEVWTIYELYSKKMFENGYIDFADMINLVIAKFNDDPKFLNLISSKYEYFLVDEYQDTNDLQNSILFSLLQSKIKPNVFVVGDDDQIIYGFQGANSENIENFLTKYPDTEVICLTENNRSTQTILDMSYKLLNQDKTRLEANPMFKNYSITKLVLPDSITRIGDCAFINSTELKKVIIPNSVTFIGNGAFAYAPIEQLKLGTSVQVIDDYAFELAKITSLTLPDSVTSIGVSAFENAELNNLKISNNLVTVEEGAFSHSVLTELTLPDTLQTIGAKAFQYSTLSELIIPASVQSIGDRAFRKSVLESLTIQGKGNSNCLTTGEGKFTSLGNDDVFGWKDGENIICEP